MISHSLVTRCTAPSGVVYHAASHTVFVADSLNYAVRAVSATNDVSTFVGAPPGAAGPSGLVNNIGTAARLSQVVGLAVDPTGSFLYLADNNGQSIRKVVIATQVVTVFAGTYSGGYFDSMSTSSALYNPLGVTVNAAGDVLIADR